MQAAQRDGEGEHAESSSQTGTMSGDSQLKGYLSFIKVQH